MKRLFLLVLVQIIVFAFLNNVYAESCQLRGSLRALGKVFTHSPNELDIAESRLKLELISTEGENTSFKIKSYLTYDSITKQKDLILQEAFVDYYSDLVDVRFGKQIIAWGKADEINPTDILNPQDLSNFSEEKNIRKIGLAALKTEWKLSDYILDAIWKIEYDNVKLPPLSSRWALFNIPGLSELPDPEYPDNKLQNTEWAFKLSRTVSLFDLSISYFDGWDNIATPVFSLNPTTQKTQLEKLKIFRTKMIGVDFSGSVSSFGLWGEAAYFIPYSSNDPLVKNPYLQYVLGSDYTFDNGIKVNLQYFQEINKEKSDEEIMSKLGIGMPLHQAISFRVEKKFGEIEEHSIELLGTYDMKGHGLFFQPKLILSPEDAFKIEVGLVLYSGEKDSIFSNFANNDHAFLKSTYSF